MENFNVNSVLDYEATRLTRLIETKKQYLSKLDPRTMQHKYLLSEIEFLEQDILPIILSKNLYLSEFNKCFDINMAKVANHKNNSIFNGILYYYHMKDPSPDRIPAVACFTNYHPQKIYMDFRLIPDFLNMVNVAPIEI